MSTENPYFELDAMDWVVAALANALAEGLHLSEVLEMARNAATPEAFDDAVNMLVLANPPQPVYPDLFNGDWASI